MDGAITLNDFCTNSGYYPSDLFGEEECLTAMRYGFSFDEPLRIAEIKKILSIGLVDWIFEELKRR